jgi:hypothetical protein
MARNQFSKWDCYSPSKRCRIELKCRRTHYPDLVIEKSKYEALMAKANDNGDIPVYLNSTPRGIYLFNLNSIDEPKWFTKRMPITTDFAKRHYINKEVGMLEVRLSANISEKIFGIEV